MDFFTWFIILTFLFAVGALLGWCIEFLFRNLISHKGPRGKYFINPGFCTGPYLPIYGIGLSVMFVMSYNFSGNTSPIYVILMITVTMTILEFIGGLFLLKVLNMRLWDYRNQPGNIMGIICPLFTLIWGAIGAVYYLFIHPVVVDSLIWLSNNLAFCFFVGLFYGVFFIDLYFSAKKAIAIRQFGNDNDIIVKYEELKELILKKTMSESGDNKSHIFSQLPSKTEEIKEALKEHAESVESKLTAVKSKRSKKNGKK